jgi:hypothetical protein
LHTLKKKKKKKQEFFPECSRRKFQILKKKKKKKKPVQLHLNALNKEIANCEEEGEEKTAARSMLFFS